MNLGLTIWDRARLAVGDTPPDPPTPIEDPPTDPPPPPPVPADLPPDPAKTGAPAPRVIPDSDDWRDKRIAKLTAQKTALEAQIASRQTATGTSTPGDAAELERLVEERSSAKASALAFNNACVSAIREGEAQYEDFQAKVTDLKRIDDRDDKGNSGPKYVALLQALIESGEAPRLLYELGSDLNRASRLMDMSPVKLGIEIAKMTMTDPPKELSGAPKPITPVGAKGTAHVAIAPDDPERADKLSTAEWMKRREAQAKSVADARRGY